MSAEKDSACTIQRTTAADAEDNDIQVQTTNNRYHVPHKSFHHVKSLQSTLFHLFLASLCQASGTHPDTALLFFCCQKKDDRGPGHGPHKRQRTAPMQAQADVLCALETWSQAVKASADLMDQ
jgi:hypothetical protein